MELQIKINYALIFMIGEAKFYDCPQLLKETFQNIHDVWEEYDVYSSVFKLS